MPFAGLPSSLKPLFIDTVETYLVGATQRHLSANASVEIMAVSAQAAADIYEAIGGECAGYTGGRMSCWVRSPDGTETEFETEGEIIADFITDPDDGTIPLPI